MCLFARSFSVQPTYDRHRIDTNGQSTGSTTLNRKEPKQVKAIIVVLAAVVLLAFALPTALSYMGHSRFGQGGQEAGVLQKQ